MMNLTPKVKGKARRLKKFKAEAPILGVSAYYYHMDQFVSTPVSHRNDAEKPHEAFMKNVKPHTNKFTNSMKLYHFSQ